MKTLLVVLIILMAQGCRTYGIEKGVDDAGNPYVKVDISSSADIEAPYVHYVRKGDDVIFDFSAEKVDNNTESFTGLFQGMMGMMMEMMQKMAAMQAGTPQ
jgi:hypothetical protein